MAFGSSQQRVSQSNLAASDSPFYRLTEGERIIRILDQEEKTHWRYWMPVNINGQRVERSVVVGGYENPIQRHFSALGKEHPEYRSLSKRISINVLCRTPVKHTTQGTVVYPDLRGVFPNQDPATGENISSYAVVPNNRVYILEFGNDLMQDFMALHNRMRHRTTLEPLAIWDFDIRLIITGAKKSRKIKAVADIDQSPLPSELKSSLKKYDLNLTSRPLPELAQERLLMGEDYTRIIQELAFERPVPTLDL